MHIRRLWETKREKKALIILLMALCPRLRNRILFCRHKGIIDEYRSDKSRVIRFPCAFQK